MSADLEGQRREQGPRAAAELCPVDSEATCWQEEAVMDALNPEQRPLDLGPSGQDLSKASVSSPACRERAVPKLQVGQRAGRTR